jgi:hypothetical protein
MLNHRLNARARDPEKLKPYRPWGAVLWVLLLTLPNIGEFSFLDGAPGDVGAFLGVVGLVEDGEPVPQITQVATFSINTYQFADGSLVGAF